MYFTGCNGAIRQATYDFLLVFHCNYVSITYFPNFEQVMQLWTIPFGGNISCTSTPAYQSAHKIWSA